HYTFPGVYQGREVEGIRLKFKGGRVVEASAKKNEEFLIKMLDQDAGARTLGEIAIGTNYAIKEFSKNTLFDEKIGGTFHAAVGAGYPESGSTNKSGLHWDMVCDLRAAKGRAGGTIEADGEVFHKDGLFTREGWPAPV
ncbi:MAG: aminopeptidase, partial [Planctomycetes bacterium]|nr:aminopeptidase [Planctomycetota bacterium]